MRVADGDLSSDPPTLEPTCFAEEVGLWRRDAPFLLSTSLPTCHVLSLKERGSQLRAPACPAYLPGSGTQGCHEDEAQGSYQSPRHTLGSSEKQASRGIAGVRAGAAPVNLLPSHPA